MASHSGEMVKAVLKDRGMTQVELARRIGRDQTLISRYLNGQIEISDKAARGIAEALEIDFDLLRRQLDRDRLERRKEHMKAEFRDVLGRGEGIDITIPDEPVHIIGGVGVEEIPDVIAIPLLDFIPIGERDLPEKETEPYILPTGLSVDTEKSFALRVSEENLTDDKVDEGDIIVIDPVAKVQDGDTILVILNGQPTLRKIYRRGGAIALQSSRENTEPLILLSQEDEFEIVGRIVLCTKIL